MEKQLLSLMPNNLVDRLKELNISYDKPLVFATADMDTDCNYRNSVMLLCSNCLIVGKDNAVSEYRDCVSRNECFDFSNFSFKRYAITDISAPAVDNLVVGGIFRINENNTETVLCAFTNKFKGRIMKLIDILKMLIDNKEIDDDKLYEEVREEFCPKCGTIYPDRNRKICPKCMDKRKIFFRLGSFFSTYKKELLVICVLCILGALLSSIWPVLNGSMLYDGVLAKNNNVFPLSLLNTKDFSILLLILALTMAGAKLIQQFFGIIQGRLVAKIVPNVINTLKKRIFGAIGELSVSFFTDKQTGGLMTRITQDATRVSDIFIDGIPFIIPNLFTIIFSCYFMFSTNWILALTAIITLPPAVIISMKLSPVLWHYNSKMFQTSRNFRAKLNDNITGARVVRAFGRESSEAGRLDKSSGFIASSQLNAMRFDLKFTILYQLTNSLSSLFTWTIGAMFVLAVFKPQLSYGTLITFTGYVSLLAGPADFFSYIFRWWSGSMNSAQRIFEILDAKPDVIESPHPTVLGEVKGEIKIENMTFGYEENRDILKDINLEVKAGKMLGIVGKSGAGKTTLVNLISRLYDPTSGSIYLDGVNLRDLKFSEIRKNVALVSQETYIFKGSIFDNIAYSNPKANKSDVIKAAISAGAHDFICKLPDGYDTLVGSGGRSMSGGERQRISIARAILANPKILILDEATAAVDTETEKNIQASLSVLIKNRTTISIAHRLSTLRDADELIVIEDGKITEHGTHDELVRLKGAYYKLLQIQSKALAMRGIGD